VGQLSGLRSEPQSAARAAAQSFDLEIIDFEGLTIALAAVRRAKRWSRTELGEKLA
jgi:hypothetical protein